MFLFIINLKRQSHKMVNTLKQFVDNLPTNCLTVFYHFVELLLKGLSKIFHEQLATFSSSNILQ